MRYLGTLVSVAALMPALAASAAKPSSDDAANCAALAGKSIAPDSVIAGAEYLAGGGSVGTTKITVPFCRVIGVATPTADSHIGFEVWLPPAAQWNGKFRGEGSGGSAGAISPSPMRDALMMGYATMSTDNGHVDGANGEHGLSWAYKHPEKMVDWAWRALHLSTVAAKKVIGDFYGKPAAKNYFVSCSAGSHHAIMEATRFPADYDGLVGGAAPWKWTSLMFGHTWNSIPGLKDPSALTPESVAILNRGMIKACDKLDGLEDGIIADPRRCTVDPVQFQCSGTSKSECLTPVQVEAARHIYAGAKKSDGTVLMPGQVRGSEAGWFAQSGGPAPGGSSWDFWRQAVFQDPDFKNVNFDFDRDTERALATRISGKPLAEVYDEKANLDAFRARGGKFIFFQGWADSVITPMMDVDFYHRIVARYGQEKTDAFFRFFPLAGMGHCGGGPGFSHIGGATGTPLKDDADHDIVRALDTWVTKDQAPSLFIGAHLDDAKKVTATRPICRYPLEARYTGHGDSNRFENFTCRAAP
ncbi:MAG TPA: tannase/feruloyl esterase family alpha/beta hydrolase [Rhizomicrobium sp.]|nr:tannase/feruloyl esterase family alpha/beta hydrolase [Rhizomicrobium sp.]